MTNKKTGLALMLIGALLFCVPVFAIPKLSLIDTDSLNGWSISPFGNPATLSIDNVNYYSSPSSLAWLTDWSYGPKTSLRYNIAWGQRDLTATPILHAKIWAPSNDAEAFTIEFFEVESGVWITYQKTVSVTPNEWFSLQVDLREATKYAGSGETPDLLDVQSLMFTYYSTISSSDWTTLVDDVYVLPVGELPPGEQPTPTPTPTPEPTEPDYSAMKIGMQLSGLAMVGAGIIVYRKKKP